MTGLREQKKTLTRQAIAEATVTVFTRYTPQGFTVAAVAKEAGVSIRTFHNYFASVDEALQFQFSLLLRSFTETMLNAPAQWDPMQCFEKSAEEMVRMIFDKGWGTTSPEAIALHLLKNSSPQFADQCKADIAEIHKAIASRESTRRGTPESPQSLHVCLVYQLSIAAVNAAMTSFGLKRDKPVADQGISENEVIEKLQQAFSEIRSRFM